MDEFDFVEGLIIKGGTEVEVLNVVSLHGAIVEAFHDSPYDTKQTLASIIAHWRKWGLPDYAQFDNDARLQGPHQHKDCIGRVIKLCLSLGVTPIFAVPREHGLQNAIESFNGQWQEKVWNRFEHENLKGLQKQSRRYIEAKNQRRVARRDAAPQRRAFPKDWRFDEKMQHCFVMLHFLLPSHQQSAEPVEPGVHSFDNPATGRVLLFTVNPDLRLDYYHDGLADVPKVSVD